MTARQKVSPIPIEAFSAFDRATDWCRQLRQHGIPHPYHQADPVPPALLRDLLVIERAVKRIADRDRANR